MRLPLLLLTALTAAPAAAQGHDPIVRYIIPGQDEPGYRAWYQASPVHPIRIAGFHHYLTLHGAAWVLPTWQVVRTASDWSKCGDAAFEVPPTSQWPNIVQTLRFIREEVIPAVGPVEAVSAYRNPRLNACAGGSRTSAHLGFFALDLVPLKETGREELVATLCAVHDRRGKAYGAGLGFYSFSRFHVDSRGFRRWVPAGEDLPCEPVPAEPEPPGRAQSGQQ
ncbi:MAG TPA: D-Ala-D-Ala carboxypeptidase family metallohydrolase [Sphingomicrobium sp.]|nr:D-Ala-D-Ala carboxypeptidase family metallohydrolase [Sphingomicrobium sp.]